MGENSELSAKIGFSIDYAIILISTIIFAWYFMFQGSIFKDQLTIETLVNINVGIIYTFMGIICALWYVGDFAIRGFGKSELMMDTPTHTRPNLGLDITLMILIFFFVVISKVIGLTTGAVHLSNVPLQNAAFSFLKGMIETYFFVACGFFTARTIIKFLTKKSIADDEARTWFATIVGSISVAIGAVVWHLGVLLGTSSIGKADPIIYGVSIFIFFFFLCLISGWRDNVHASSVGHGSVNFFNRITEVMRSVI